jgi:hypothetical protein
MSDIMKCKQKSYFKLFDMENYEWKCNEEALEGSEYCILHTKYPEFGSPEYQIIDELKTEKIKEKLKKKDFDYIAAILSKLGFKDMDISHIELRNAKIDDFALKNVNIIGRNVDFGEGSIFEHFNSFINCQGATIDDIYLENVKILDAFVLENVKTRQIILNKVSVGMSMTLDKITIEKYVQFIDLIVGGALDFQNAKVSCDNANFNLPQINEGINLNNTKFEKPLYQEILCRYAKNNWESLGDKEKADYHYYREMEAKRLQKPFYIRYPEWIFQKSFGYGLYPLRMFLTFFSIFVFFSIIYWHILNTLNNSIINVNLLIGLRFSFLTLIIPAYGIVNPNTINFGIFIIIEAILGAFMWPLFIATFARKYMR